MLHGSVAAGTAGPASRRVGTCAPGDHVLIIDEGLGFNPARGVQRVVLVGDETALPAIASICASLPESAKGTVIVETPSVAAALEFGHPVGVDVHSLVRTDADAPGTLALDALRDLTLPAEPFHAWISGEQALASGGRKLLVGERGIERGRGPDSPGRECTASRRVHGLPTRGSRTLGGKPCTRRTTPQCQRLPAI